MTGPDLSRGGGFGDPEMKAELIDERHAEAAKQIKADRDAKHALEGAEKERTPRVPWYRRLFHRS
jgi:hypothetical protein